MKMYSLNMKKSVIVSKEEAEELYQEQVFCEYFDAIEKYFLIDGEWLEDESYERFLESLISYYLERLEDEQGIQASIRACNKLNGVFVSWLKKTIDEYSISIKSKG